MGAAPPGRGCFSDPVLLPPCHIRAAPVALCASPVRVGGPFLACTGAAVHFVCPWSVCRALCICFTLSGNECGVPTGGTPGLVLLQSWGSLPRSRRLADSPRARSCASLETFNECIPSWLGHILCPEERKLLETVLLQSASLRGGDGAPGCSPGFGQEKTLLALLSAVLWFLFSAQSPSWSFPFAGDTRWSANTCALRVSISLPGFFCAQPSSSHRR